MSTNIIHQQDRFDIDVDQGATGLKLLRRNAETIPVRFTLVATQPRLDDFEQDRGGHSFSIDEIDLRFPNYLARYKEWQSEGAKSDPDLAKRALPPGIRTLIPNISNDTPVKLEGYSPAQDVALGDHLQPDVQEQEAKKAVHRFDPRFIEIEKHPDPQIEKALDITGRWLAEIPASLQTLLTMMQQTSQAVEDRFSEVLAELFQDITDELRKTMPIEGESQDAEGIQWQPTGTRKLYARPDLPQTAAQKRQTDKPDLAATFIQRESKTPQPNPNEPDVFDAQILAQALPRVSTIGVQTRSMTAQTLLAHPPDNRTSRKAITNGRLDQAKPARLTHENVLTLVEVKKLASLEMRFLGSDMQKTVPRILRYAGRTIRNNPIAGRVAAMTVIAGRIRLYFLDAFSYATSKLYDLGNPDHAREIVKMIAFISGRTSNALECWDLDQLEFNAYTPSPLLPSGHDKTCPVFDPPFHPAEPSTQAHEVGAADKHPTSTSVRHLVWDERPRLLWWAPSSFGRRTTLYYGWLLEGLNKFPAVLKSMWSPKRLWRHEHDMLVALHGNVLYPESLYFNLDAETRADVVKTLPESLGFIKVLDDDGKPPCTRFLPAEQSSFRSSLEGLELSCMVIKGPVGSTMDSSKLRPSEIIHIFIGVTAHLWYAALHSVHFRDLNMGNILWDRVDGKIVGWLIDYGYARHKNRRRDPSLIGKALPSSPSLNAEGLDDDWIALCEDDKRSGTMLFMSCAILKTGNAVHTYGKLLVNAYDPNTSDSEEDDEQDTTSQLAALKMELLRSRHRYIDDLESMIYCICWQMASTRTNKNQLLGSDGVLRDILVDVAKKEGEWKNSLREMAAMLKAGPSWERMIVKMAKTVRKARQSLENAVMGSKEDMPVDLHPIEDGCYARCMRLLVEGAQAMAKEEKE